MRKLLAAVVAFGALAAPAHATQIAAVVVVPQDDPFPFRLGAIGLLVPGAGETVTREGALAALVRGRTKKSLLGGVPGGKPTIVLSKRPGALTIYVSLPPAGTHRNDRRYPIAIVGGGYHGILKSPSTRIRGLISIADVAPTALGKKRITSDPDTDALAELRRLDSRLSEQNRSRNWAMAVLSLAVILGSLLTVRFGSDRIGRAALFAAPVALGSSIALSGAGVGRLGVFLPLLAALTIGVSAIGGVLLPGPRAISVVFAALIAAYLIVLVAWPAWPALAAIGPNPSEGGRFYGSSNVTSALLLSAALFAGASLGLRGLLPVALLSIVAVGWSRAGADGGGLVVLVAAFAALFARLAWGRLTARTTVLATAGAVAVGLALVGLDAATGGHSHVTRKIGQGPGALADEVGNRLHISAERLATSWHSALIFGVSLAALAVLVWLRPRFPAGDALLVGIVISLLVNDSPSDVASAAAISYGVLWAYERIRSRPCAAEP